MRVLITTPSAWGHLQPMVPLAKALQARGHELRWATGADSCDWLAGVRRAAGRRRDSTARPADRPREACSPIYGGCHARTSPMSCSPRSSAASLPRRCCAICCRWSPSGLRIWSSMMRLNWPVRSSPPGSACPASPSPLACCCPSSGWHQPASTLPHLWRSVGLQPRPFGGCYDHLYLDMCPPALQPAPPDYIPRRQLLRPLSYVDVAAEGLERSSIDWPAGFPAVYLTMGTVFNDLSLLRSTVDAVATWALTCSSRLARGGSCGSGGPAERTYASNAMSRRPWCWIAAGSSSPMPARAPRSPPSAVDCPQLCLPQGADQFLNATAIALAGAGLSLHPDAAERSGDRRRDQPAAA